MANCPQGQGAKPRGFCHFYLRMVCYSSKDELVLTIVNFIAGGPYHDPICHSFSPANFSQSVGKPPTSKCFCLPEAVGTSATSGLSLRRHAERFVPLILALFLILFQFSPSASASVLFSDDFNDNAIDPTKWTYEGVSVSEQNGIMSVNTDATDNGGRLFSKWILVNGSNPIIVSRRTIQHYANNYFDGNYRLQFVTNGDNNPDFSFGVDYANYSYSGGGDCPRYGFFLVPDSENWAGGSRICTKNISVPVPAKWDTWFTEELIYDPVSGLLSYAIDGQVQTTFNVGVLPSAANYRMRLHSWAWGWWTGHYDHFDDIVVSQGGIIELPRTGQTTCYDTAGIVILCAGTGQDVEIQAGVPWPTPRFTDNGNSTVTDNLTGLMWTKDGNAPGPAICSPATTLKTWQEALDYVA